MRQWCLALGLYTLAAVAYAHPEIDAFSKGLKTLSGRFEQSVFDANGELREQSQGSVALAAPRQFRWDYEDPYPQTIVADGDRVWIYDPDLEQVSVQQQSLEEQSSPLAALIDPAVLEQQFVVSDDGGDNELHWVKLVPRKAEGANFSEARLGLREGRLLQMEMIDTLQQKTMIVFHDWQRNVELAADRFRFVPPPGTDVVGDAGTDAEVFPLD